MPEMLEKTKWLTVLEVAEILGVTDGRVRQCIRSGELAAVKFGNTWAVSEKEVQRFSKIERVRGNPNFVSKST